MGNVGDAAASVPTANAQPALHGIRVVALEQAVAGPLCTRHLADLGADVIKIERPEGDFARRYDTSVKGQSSYFVWLNRGKRSITLDLKRRSALDVLNRLISRADVFVQNLGPGATDRLGISSASLRARHPSLIVCSISGYGSGGPYETRKAFDLLLQGETGVIATTGTDDMFAKVGISVGDIGAGVYGAMGVLTALYHRQATGQGQIVETSLFDALAEWMGYPVYYTMYGGEPPARAGVRHATVVPYGCYRCGDGQLVNFAVQTEGQWQRFCRDVCEHPQWEHDARFATSSDRRRNRAALEQLIEDAFSAHDRTEIARRLEVADIPYGDLNTIAQFIDHPQLDARDRWRDVDSPAGEIRSLIPPIGFERFETCMGPIPEVGQHTSEILEDLGYSDGEIEALRQDGSI